MKNLTTTLLFNIVAVITAGWAVSSGNGYLSVIPVLVIMSYVAFGWRLAARSPSSVKRLADDTFYLGHVCTFASIGGLMIRGVREQPQGLAIDAILLAGVVALSTTLIGMILMRVLRAFAELLVDAEEASGTAIEQTLKLLDEMALPKDVLEQLKDRLMMSITQVEVFGTTACDAAAGIKLAGNEAKNCGESFAQMAVECQRQQKAIRRELALVVNAIGETEPILKEVQSVLDSFVELTRRSIRDELAA